MTTYSHSRLSTFEDCPLKYKYTYIDKLDRDRRDSIEAFMGGLVHATMEKLYHRLEKDDKNFGRVFVHFRHKT